LNQWRNQQFGWVIGEGLVKKNKTKKPKEKIYYVYRELFEYNKKTMVYRGKNRILKYVFT